jgi:hypothetical protein
LLLATGADFGGGDQGGFFNTTARSAVGRLEDAAAAATADDTTVETSVEAVDDTVDPVAASSFQFLLRTNGAMIVSGLFWGMISTKYCVTEDDRGAFEICCQSTPWSVCLWWVGDFLMFVREKMPFHTNGQLVHFSSY